MSRKQTPQEEIANSLSHGLGFLVSVIAAPILILDASKRLDVISLVGVILFSGSMMLLYLSSTIYHALPWGRAKKAFLLVDHSAIFLLIAGTYTPFTLGILRGFWGWVLLGLVWSFALVGMSLKLSRIIHNTTFFTILYLAMGWLILIDVQLLIERIDPTGLHLLIAGGLAYTLGVGFFATDTKLKFGHFIWHLFVLAGTGFHYFAVLWYAS